MASLTEWTRAILDNVFPREPNGKMVHLSFDTAALSEIGSVEFNLNEELVLMDFIEAISEHVISDNQFDFSKVFPSESLDYLPFLATSVLAASRMNISDSEIGTIRSTNFHYQLNSLFGLNSKNRLPSFDNLVFEEMWVALQVFLQSDDRGMLRLTQGPSTRKFVWYPMSQTMLNSRDRVRLRSFFFEEGLFKLDRTGIQDQEIRQIVAPWITRSSLSKRTKENFEDPNRSEAMFVEVIAEFREWDGLPDPGTGSSGDRSFQTALKVYLRWRETESGHRELQLMVRKKAFIKSEVTVCYEGKDLARLNYDDQDDLFFQPFSVPRSFRFERAADFDCSDGEGRKFVACYRPQTVFPFYRDEETGYWISSDQISLGGTYHFVFHKENENLILKLLGELSDISEETILERKRDIDESWICIRHLKILKPLRFYEEKFTALNCDLAKRIFLEGGVKVRAEKRRKNYFLRRPPSLGFIGNWGNDDDVEINRKLYKVSALKVASVKDLFREGENQVRYGDGRTINFALVLCEPLAKDAGRLFQLEGKYFSEVFENFDLSKHLKSSGIVVQGNREIFTKSALEILRTLEDSNSSKGAGAYRAQLELHFHNTQIERKRLIVNGR